MRSATYDRILRARSMRFAFRRLLLEAELASRFTFSGLGIRGMYPSDEMLGSRAWKGSKIKDTLTISLGGIWF